jgi:hypothetical protein
MNLTLKYQHKINKPVLMDIISALLILLFVYAASSKLFDYTQFKMQLERSPIIASYAGIIAWLIPTVELTIAAALTVKNIRLYGLYASLFLLFIFTFYIGGMLLSGIHLPCSCGGIIQGFGWGQHLLFNLFFMALSVIGIILWWKQKQDILIKNKNLSRK